MISGELPLRSFGVDHDFQEETHGGVSSQKITKEAKG
jgi:hypothetical protein